MFLYHASLPSFHVSTRHFRNSVVYYQSGELHGFLHGAMDTMLQVSYESMVPGVIFFAVADTNRLIKFIRRACSVLGVELDML